MEWIYKDYKVTISTSKTNGVFRSVVSIVRPEGSGKVLLMMGKAFPVGELAQDFGNKLAREWIDENAK